MTILAALLSMLIAATLAHTDEVAQQPFTGFDPETSAPARSSYEDFGRPGESSRVAASNDIYRLKISDRPAGGIPDRARDPIEVFGNSGYYLYDLDAWEMVSSGPIIGPYRERSYSLFGSGVDGAPLNAWTMRSEFVRSNVSIASGTRASWSYEGWRF
jgi:hypothetical protein